MTLFMVRSYAILAFSNECNKSLNLGNTDNFRLNLGKTLLTGQTGAEDDFIGFFQPFAGCCVKAIPPESYKVRSKQFSTHTMSEHVRRHIKFITACSAKESILTDSDKLLNSGHTADDHVTSNFNMTGKVNGIGHDDIIIHDAVMSDMSVSHKHAVRANAGFTSPLHSASVNSYTLTNAVIITNSGVGFFSLIRGVLRFATYDRMRVNMIACPQFGIILDDDMRLKKRSVSDLAFCTNNDIGANFDISPQLCG